jgi:hypothetical protein
LERRDLTAREVQAFWQRLHVQAALSVLKITGREAAPARKPHGPTSKFGWAENLFALQCESMESGLDTE